MSAVWHSRNLILSIDCYNFCENYSLMRLVILMKISIFLVFNNHILWDLKASLPNGVLNVPYVPACPTFPTCPCAQVYYTEWKIKNIGFNEIKCRFVHWYFQGCWMLIWTLIKISFLKIGSKNIKFFYAEGQNNTYKCRRSKQHL